MKIRYILILLIYPIFIIAQKDKHVIKHSIYLEALGTGGYGSINYDCTFLKFKKHKIYLSGRIGTGTNNFTDFENKFNPDLIFTSGLYAFYGKNHHVELGINFIMSLIVQYNPSVRSYRKLNSHLGFSIGYRYQKHPKGLITGIRYTPILEFNTHFRHWAAAYIGYCF